MAIMIPQVVRNFEKASLEDVMFKALSALPNDYFVFHSFRITTVTDGVLNENETDFIIFNPSRGIICLEAKAGHIRYENGDWLYASGIRMHNGGPYLQAQTNKYKLINYLRDKKFNHILDNCKFLHGVWFPSISTDDLRGIHLPSEADITFTMTKEALSEPQKFIDGIYETETPNHIATNLSKRDCDVLIQKILCPSFNVFPTSSFNNDLRKIVFHRLLKEQTAILDFLCEQRTAAINGAAGTGKTMVAVEKARRNAEKNEKVLFLCYNNELKSFLYDNYKNDNIDFYTIDGFACKMCKTSTPDYNKLEETLENYYLSGGFPYEHIIIDEGQDFGQERMEDSKIIKWLYDMISDYHKGSFYIFYDRLQMIQSEAVPDYIENADCKLTLYKNCRNTENIAKTSLMPINSRRVEMYDGCVPGALAEIVYCDEGFDAQIDYIIDRLIGDGVKNSEIVILTCKTADKSVVNEYVKNGLYKDKIKFTTCRKFKGLESDAVILVDVDYRTFTEKNALIYYVGASRAKLFLSIVANLSDNECIDLLNTVFHYKLKIRNPKKSLTTALNSKLTKAI